MGLSFPTSKKGIVAGAVATGAVVAGAAAAASAVANQLEQMTTRKDEFNLAKQGSALGNIAKFEKEGNGSLANKLVPTGGGVIDIANNYKWTLSNIKANDEIPYIRLKEFYCNESQIKKLIDRYAGGTSQAAEGILIQQDILSVYETIYPKDEPTGFNYILPYFNNSAFELQSSPWKALTDLMEPAKNIAAGAIDMAAEAATRSNNKYARIGGGLTKLVGGKNVVEGVQGAVGSLFSSIGEVDRPKIFNNHQPASITVKFPLYNTLDINDWSSNRDFIYLFRSQNLFNKRNFITGVPPVFYEIYIPGQYYCYAASVSEFKVDYLGNQRLLYKDYIVPDAYQISITFTELVMPSKNQFEAITSGAAHQYVTTSTKK